MKKIYALMKREMKAYYSSPLAYSIICIFLVLSSIWFYRLLYMHVRSQSTSVTESIISPLATWMAFILMLILPLVSMRLLTEERKTGTSEFLLTSPLSTLQIVLGKYLGALSILFIMLVLTFPFPLVLFLKASPEPGPLFLMYLGVFLIGGLFIAIGLFTSSLTENQIISALICFTLIILLWLEDSLRNAGTPFLSDILTNMSILQSLGDFAAGVLDTKNVIYFLSFIVFFLFLTQRVIDSSKWR